MFWSRAPEAQVTAKEVDAGVQRTVALTVEAIAQSVSVTFAARLIDTQSGTINRVVARQRGLTVQAGVMETA